MMFLRRALVLACVLLFLSSSSASVSASASEQEPVYGSRSWTTRRDFAPAAAISNQVFVGRGHERLESAAGAEGLSGEPCYPGPCFADSARPRPVRCKNCLKGLDRAAAGLRFYGGSADKVYGQVTDGTLAGRSVDINVITRAHRGDFNRPNVDPFPAFPKQQLSPETPAQVGCGEWCSGKKEGDAYFLKVDKSPLPPTTYASVAGEGGEMARIEERLSRRRSALEAQQNWLRRASEASDAVLREIQHVAGQKEDIERDLKALLEAQSSLQLKLRHDQIAARLNDFTVELMKVEENKREVAHYKGEIEHKTKFTQHKIKEIEKAYPQPPQHFAHEELEDPEMHRPDLH